MRNAIPHYLPTYKMLIWSRTLSKCVAWYVAGHSQGIADRYRRGQCSGTYPLSCSEHGESEHAASSSHTAMKNKFRNTDTHHSEVYHTNTTQPLWKSSCGQEDQ